jgi:FMN phosphatase YigB (HAD superfamily)
MSWTILLDLDDTLLQNNMDTFAPAYYQALSNHLAPYISPEIMLKSLYTGTLEMIANRDPIKTLETAFDEVFFSGVNHSKTDLAPVLQNFYSTKFPELKSHTVSFPDTPGILSNFLEAGHQLVIATNPLFPKAAILERLEWAGVSAKKFSYKYVPSYEESHFSKPSLEYYAELYVTLGYPDTPVIMVGDDEQLDIDPAKMIGFETFKILSHSHPDNLPHGLTQLPKYLTEHSNIQSFQIKKEPPVILAFLRAAAAQIHGIGLKRLFGIPEISIIHSMMDLDSTLIHQFTGEAMDPQTIHNPSLVDCFLSRRKELIGVVSEKGFESTETLLPILELVNHDRESIISIQNIIGRA